jgi:hypothetical protein
MLRLRCPNCTKTLSVPDTLAGKAGLCPHCKSKVRVPQASVTHAPPTKKHRPVKPDDDYEVIDAVEVEEDEAPPRRRHRDEEDEERSERRITARSGRDGIRSRRRDDDDDDYDRPRRSRYEDDDDRPRRSRDDDEDEDDRPRRRRLRDEDDDRPRRRRRRRAGSGGPGGLSPLVWTGIIVGGICLLGCVGALILPPLGLVIAGVGLLIAVIGRIWFLAVAFQDDVIQGILCWWVPFYDLFYLIMNFDEEKLPFFTSIAGVVVMIIGFCAGGVGAALHGGPNNF